MCIRDSNNVEEIAKVNTNYAANSSVSSTCNNAGNTSCYKGKKITINDVPDIEASSDVKIYIDGEDVSGSSTWSKVTGSTTLVVTLGKDVSYSADPNSGVINSTVNVTIVNGMPTAGLEYDYRYLAETWSSPRVFRLPNSGAGDSLHDDDIYAAVMGGGYGVNVPGLGSNVLVVNLENGKLIKQIDIPDLRLNNIANSVPATPVVITPDLSLAANFKGALVYINDLEGKITKINLTNMQGSYAYNQTSGAVTQTPPTGTANSGTMSQDIKLYDNYTFFDLEASTKTNNRYMYHSMEAGKGAKSKKFWLFGGTGNFNRIADTVNPSTGAADMDNIVYGVNHKNLKASDKVIAAASCTTNCLAPVAKVVNETFGIERGFMTTIHSYTTDQRLLDNSHKDLRRARSAPNSMIPTTTGATKSLGDVIPELKGKVEGISIRIPTPNALSYTHQTLPTKA